MKKLFLKKKPPFWRFCVFLHLYVEFVKKWKYEGDHYIASCDNDGNENQAYFLQDSEMDAYAYSYAIMKYKYNDVSKLYVPPIYDEKFYEIVDMWIKTFKDEKL